MPYYSDPNTFVRVMDNAFAVVHAPGQTCQHSGIYRCVQCGWEAACNERDPFPPQDHHGHPRGLPPIRWKAVALAKHRAS